MRFPMTTARCLRSCSVAMAGACSMALLSGCPDDSADMAKQLAEQGRQRQAGSPPAGKPADNASAAGAAPKGAGGAAQPKGGQPAGGGLPAGARDPGQPGDPAGKEGAAAAEAEAGPVAIVNVGEIKAPGARYTKAGRYDITMEVSVTPSVEKGVWVIDAVNAEGKVVGTQQQVVVLLREEPKPMQLNDFYCTEIPTDVRMTLTDKDANNQVTADEGGEAAGGAGGGQTPGGARGGGGASPPAGNSPGGGDGATPPSDGGGDGGGGDDGIGMDE